MKFESNNIFTDFVVKYDIFLVEIIMEYVHYEESVVVKYLLERIRLLENRLALYQGIGMVIFYLKLLNNIYLNKHVFN